MGSKKYRNYYPDKEKISKNKITKGTYNKIRECFKSHYIGENFSNPMYPREQEFLQWIKKFLNQMEFSLSQNKEQGGERMSEVQKTKDMLAEEFVMDLKAQGYGLLKEYRKIFLEEIWIDYLYSSCPGFAVMIDPKIIEATRRMSRGEGK